MQSPILRVCRFLLDAALTGTSPRPRLSIALGPSSASGLSVTNFSLVGVLGTFAALLLMVMGFSSLFVMLAVRSTSQDTQMMIVNLLNLPLLFASNAMFPAKLMPGWLQPIVQVNPISYATDISRQLLLGSTGMASLGFDFLYLGSFAVALTVLGTMVSWRFLSR